jgi:4-methylaminobutanoate oxidase (formaldehyde-forming)
LALPDRAETAASHAARLPVWTGKVDPRPLAGGITNTNFVVEDAGRRYVVRIGGDIDVHGIVRRNELAASRAAHRAGIAPEVVYAQPGALVLDFVEGRTLGPEDVRDPGNLARIVEVVRRCHCEIPKHLRGPGFMFWPFHVMRDYRHTLREQPGEGISASLDDLLSRAERLERAVGPIEVVFGHNDLLAANFIDDGARLWLVDWDYAGFNSPLFDLGGVASNSGLSPGASEQLLEAYMQSPITDELRLRFAAMSAASLLREDAVEHGFAVPFGDRLRLPRLHGGEPDALRSRVRRLRGHGAFMKVLPAAAKVVIVGGGIVGCSVAYHLGKMGWTDVLLLERGKLSSGSTWHAAGLVGQLRTNANVTQLLGYSVALYDRLEAETGLATGWKRNGGLRLACNQERWTEVKRQATTAHSFGLDMQLLSPREARDLWPLMNVEDVIGAAFLPTDGQANPSDIVQALARGARQGGVSIHEDVGITGVRVENGRVRGVETSAGYLRCEKLVVCAGQWSREIGRMAGVNVPLVSVQHQYVITEAIAGVTPDLPTLRDPDRLTYYKEEVGGLVMGGYEPNPIPWAANGIPEGFEFQLLQPDWDHFTPILELALPRVPALQEAGIKQLINGPESFTPDGNFILGEAPRCGEYSSARASMPSGSPPAAGAGMALAEWVAKGEPPYDLWPVDIRRFGRNHFDVDWVRTRTLEAYGKHYTMAWPFEEHGSGRPLRRSPLTTGLKAQGAVFGEKLGWERPNWFADPAQETRARHLFLRPRQTGSRRSAANIGGSRAGRGDRPVLLREVPDGRARRRSGAFLDLRQRCQQAARARSPIPDAEPARRHRMRPDRRAAGRGPVLHRHRHRLRHPRLRWIGRNIPMDRIAHLIDVTSQNAVLSLMGPRARDIFRLTATTFPTKRFPFGTCRTIAVAGAPRSWRSAVTYVGELGWELHIPVEFAATVYERLMAAGRPFGVATRAIWDIESHAAGERIPRLVTDIGPGP